MVFTQHAQYGTAAPSSSFRAYPGCFTRSNAGYGRASPGSGRCTVRHPELVSVIRLCLGNPSGFRHAVELAALSHGPNCREALALHDVVLDPAPHIGNIKPHQAQSLQPLHTVTLNRPLGLDIISESQKVCPNLHPHSPCPPPNQRLESANLTRHGPWRHQGALLHVLPLASLYI